MTQIKRLLQRLLDPFERKREHRVEKFIGTALLTGSLLFPLAILVRNWSQVEPYLHQMDIKLLMAGQLCTFMALLLGGVMWTLIQTAFDLGFSWHEGIAIHLLSGITKYIPGYAWQYMSKAYLSRKRGASAKQITMAMLTEFILLLAGGGITVAPWGWLTLHFQHPIPLAFPAWGWSFVGAAMLLVAIAWNGTVTRWGINEHRQIRQRSLWAALGVAIIGWMTFAAAVWFMSRAVYSVAVNDFPQHVVALVVSSILGLLVIVVPNGLGVREMTLALLLQGAVPLALGIVVSLLVRFSVVLGEMIGMGAVLHLGLYRLHRTSRME